MKKDHLNHSPNHENNKFKITPAQWVLFFCVLGTGIVILTVNYQILKSVGSWLYGLPLLLLALGISLAPKAKLGVTIKAITITLLLLASSFPILLPRNLVVFTILLCIAGILIIYICSYLWAIDKAFKNRKEIFKIDTSQWKLFFTVLILGIVAIAYNLLRHSTFQSTAAVYVGLPILLALGFSLTPKSKSAVGATMKAITIALLLSAPVFQEGYICILFSAPIFYMIGYFVAKFFDQSRERNKPNKFQLSAISILLALMTLEGSSELTSFPREHDIVVSKTIPASLAMVRDALAKTPQFDENKPFFLRIFPYPVAMQGEGLNVGDTRRATFVAYKHIFWNRVEGDAVFNITEATDRKITFTLVSDTSYVGHYVGWKKSEVELTPIDADHTRVTWMLSFHRKYDPYWYFGSLQKYAVRLVAEELIDHAATPKLA